MDFTLGVDYQPRGDQPAAIEQLNTLAKELDIAFYPSDSKDKPLAIAQKALEQAKKQYMDVIRQFKITKEELDFVIGNDNTLPYKLYFAITDNQFIDDEMAAKMLYNQKPTYPPYKALKTELKKKLQHAVLLLDAKQPEFNDVQQAYYQCQKN